MLKNFVIKKIIFSLCLVIFLLGILSPVFAVSDIETDFPEIGGEDITTKSKLPEVVSYALNAFILVALLASSASLIYGGVIYLSSAGDPGKTGAARKRMIGSLLGLVILFSSYLVLKVINPKLTIPTITRKPIFGGVLLLDKKAVEKYKSTINTNENGQLLPKMSPDLLEEFLSSDPSNQEESHAKYLSYSVPDISAYFGKGFKPVAVYFFNHANAGVVPYVSKNFVLETKAFFYPQCMVDLCEFDIPSPQNIGTAPEDMSDVSADMASPEIRSVALVSVRPGLYLDTAAGDNIGTRYNFSSSPTVINDLGKYDLDFQKLSIEAQNWEFAYDDNGTDGIGDDKIKCEQKNNYAIILQEDSYLRGQLRIFFRSFYPGKPDIETAKCGVGCVYGNIGAGLPSQCSEGGAGIDASSASNDYIFRSIIQDARFELDGATDAYGKVDSPSSALIFNMPDMSEDENFKTDCKVKICEDQSKVLCQEFHTSIFQPVNISSDLDDKVSYLEIGGNCVVALFENPIPDREKCLNHADVAKSDTSQCWKDGTPGKHSQIFYPLYGGAAFDLSNEEICNCTPWYGLRTWWGAPCTSAIAIYPMQ